MAADDDEFECSAACDRPPTVVVVPDPDDDDGVYAACDEHIDEIANQFHRPEVVPIAEWREGN